MKKSLSISLKDGFLLYLFSSLLLFVQFLGYLFGSYITEIMDFAGYVFFVFAAFSHAALLMLIPFLLYLLFCLSIRHLYKLWFAIFVFLCFTTEIIAYINGFVFQLYKFHINGFVLEMVFGPDAGQIFVFDKAVYLKCFTHTVILILIFLLFSWLSTKYGKFVRRKPMIWFSVITVLMMIFSHLAHVYAFAANKISIPNAALALPQYYPMTANRAMMKLGVLKVDDWEIENANGQHNNVLFYPLHELQTTNDIIRKNIIFIILDSWNTRTFNEETCPRITDFSKQSLIFKHHLSSSNGTQGGIFGLFTGISPTYCRDFEINGTQPLFIKRLLELNYDILSFASAGIVNPPFYKFIFGNVKNIQTGTIGKTPFDRDQQITKDFISYLENHSENEKPFFAFLFYDLMHGIKIPKEYLRFQPSWEYADYTSLNNNIDPTPFFNLYRNCAFVVDSLVGKVLDKLRETNLLENTIVVITGDHGQEFNENRKNFWGHGSNFSEAQIKIPMIFFDKSIAPGEIDYQTSHYDIMPTIMNLNLGAQNPLSDYSMGTLLTDSLRLPFHIASCNDNYAIITDSTIYEKKTSGRLVVTDKNMNIQQKCPKESKMLLEAFDDVNRFYRKK